MPRGNRMAGRWVTWVGAAVCLALAVGSGPLQAAAAEDAEAQTPAVGAFALGDGIEGLVDAKTGALSFSMPVAGVALGWDARLTGADRFGFGPGWALGGLAMLDLEGGARVFPASGGVFELDASSATGLSGFPTTGVRLVATGDTIEARPDGSVVTRVGAYRLTEVGGTRTYFNAAGDPIASIDRFGNRRDWVWADDTAHRLLRIVDEHGISTELDWADPARVVITRGAGARDAFPAPAARPESTVERTGRGVTAIVDPTGALTRLDYDGTGRLERVSAASGAVTELDWQVRHDGAAAVEGIRVLDGAGGEVVSRRTWSAAGSTGSGWPERDGMRSLLSRAPATSRTVLGDGASEVRSEYDGRGRLVGQDLAVTTRSGTVVLREQRLEYPDDTSPAADTAVSDRPSRLVVTHHDPVTGTSRTVEERYEHDAHGRLTRHTAPDGVVTTTVYDDRAAIDGVPVGLVLRERSIAPDGLVAEVRSELSPERSAAAAIERWTTDRQGVETRLSRDEFAHAADGTVVEHRAYGQGGAGTPKVTTWQRSVAAGTMQTIQTVGAGTSIAATTVEVTDLVLGASIAMTDPVGNTTVTTYDAATRPVEITAPGGRITRTEYRSAQHDGRNAVIVTAPTGVEVTEERDVLGRVVHITDNIDLDEHGVAVPVEGAVRTVERRAYPDPATVQVTDAWGQTATARKDVFGRVVRAQAPGGVAQVTSYDDVGNRRITGLTPTGDLADAERVEVTRLDVRGEVIEVTGTRHDGVETPHVSRALDGFGRETAASDGLTTVETSFDRFGNPAVVASRAETGAAASEFDSAARERVDHVAERRFDAFGVSAEKTVSDGGPSQSGGSRTLDPLGRTATETDQAGRTTSYEYTPDGLVARVVSASGQVTEQTYDPETRVPAQTVVTSPIGETVRSAYEIDSASGAHTAAYDPTDRERTEIRYEADAHGNTTAVRYPDGRAITHRYDRHGRRLESTDVTGAVTRFGYTEAGWLAEAVQTDRDGHELARVAYEYDELGRVVRKAQGNGVVSDYTFTSASEVATETTTGPDGQLQASRRYVYDPFGELTERAETTQDASGEPTTTSTTYRYDTSGRLVGSDVREGDGPASMPMRHTDYQLTVAGDIAAETVIERPGAMDERVTERTFDYGPTGQLTRVETTDPAGVVSERVIDYDAEGNLARTSDGVEYVYDAANRVVSHTGRDGTRTVTGYWASGRPAATETIDATGATTGTNVRYWEGSTLVNDAHEGEGVASYLFGAARQARTVLAGAGADADADGARTSYYGIDRHGSVTALTGPDGDVIEHYAYSDYGREIAPSGSKAEAVGLARNPFRFAGEQTNPDGTQLLDIRVYDPETMRFTSRDPADQFSKYHFAGLNPVRFVDPTGRTPQVDTSELLFGIGMASTVIGFVSSILTGGGLVPIIGSGLVGIFDAGVGIALHIAETSPGSVSEQSKLSLTGIAVVVGVAAMVGPWFFGTKGSTLKRTVIKDEEWIEMAKFSEKPVRSNARQAMRRLVPQWEKLDDHLGTAAGTFKLNQSLGILGVTKSDLLASLREVDRLLSLRSPNPVKLIAKRWQLGQSNLQVPDDVVNRIWFFAEQDRKALGTSKTLAKWFQDDLRDLDELVIDGGLMNYASKYPAIRSMLDSIVAKVERVLGKKIYDFRASDSDSY